MTLLILNFDFRFRQEVKVKLGSLFVNIFLTINLLWLLRYDFLLILNFDFRFRQEVKVTVCKYF